MLKTILATVLLFSTITVQRADTGRQYPIDTNHSTVGFTVSIMGGLSKVNGKFTDFTVNITNDESDITKSSFDHVLICESSLIYGRSSVLIARRSSIAR